MGIKARILLAITAIAIVAGPAWVWAQNEKIKRAAPPKFSKGVTDVFAVDPKTNLSGERPAFTGGTPSPMPATGGPTTTDTPMVALPAGAFAWSNLIDASVLEAEVKSLKGPVAEQIKTPAKFKGGGAKELRQHFSVLAMMFNITAEYDAAAKWKDQALAARELFAKAANNAKVGTDQSFAESKLRSEDIEKLLSGEKIPTPPAIDPKEPWSKVVARPPLMSRLKLGAEERLAAWVSNKDEFTKNIDKVSHEAQIVAAIAEVIKREGFDQSDDDTYKEYANAMLTGALGVKEAAKTKNHDAARAAQAKMTKACSDCHGGFR